MRVLVCGDRKWRDGMRIYNVLCSMKADHPDLSIIEGGAEGADTYAYQAADSLRLPCISVHAEWEKYGRKAGPIRNRKMLDLQPDLVLAFHSNLQASRGTKDCVREAERRGIKVTVVDK